MRDKCENKANKVNIKRIKEQWKKNCNKHVQLHVFVFFVCFTFSFSFCFALNNYFGSLYLWLAFRT